MPVAVIKMEGGTDHDLRILDMPPEEEVNREKTATVPGGAESPKKEDLKTLPGDCKPSVEKDKTEKVCTFKKKYPVSINFIERFMTADRTAGGE